MSTKYCIMQLKNLSAIIHCREKAQSRASPTKWWKANTAKWVELTLGPTKTQRKSASCEKTRWAKKEIQGRAPTVGSTNEA